MMYNGENIPIYRTTHTSHDTPLVEFSLKATVEPPIDFKSAVLRLTICPQVHKGSGHMWREEQRLYSQQAETPV
jgi:hypothetical protein